MCEREPGARLRGVAEAGEEETAGGAAASEEALLAAAARLGAACPGPGAAMVLADFGAWWGRHGHCMKRELGGGGGVPSALEM